MGFAGGGYARYATSRGGRLTAARCPIVFLNSGHYAELEETLGAGLPVILVTLALALLLLVLAAIPPSVLPAGISGLLGPRRRQVAAVGVSLCLGALIGILVVFWAL